MLGVFSDQIASYPAAAKKFWHSLGVKASSAMRMASHKSEIVRSAAARRSPLNLERPAAELCGKLGDGVKKAA